MTHNKGIMNGVDAVLLATGQDWRAVDAGCHAFASRSGKYQPLTKYQLVKTAGGIVFRGMIELPMSVGTVGGALAKNPLYQQSLKLLGDPSSKELGELVASVGLAQNFAALRALVVEGIQRGHMQLHLRAEMELKGRL